MDVKDLRILELLQSDSTIPIREVAAEVSLSVTPCGRRINKMKSDGVILREVALLDAKKVNLSITAFVFVKASTTSIEWLHNFAALLDDIPEIIEAYRLNNDIDFVLKVVVPNIAAYSEVYETLIDKSEFASISSSFAMEELKCTSALPLNYLEKNENSIAGKLLSPPAPALGRWRKKA